MHWYKPSSKRKENKKCGVKHQNQYVDCTAGVMYKLPLSCHRAYVGQTVLYLNQRLREHASRAEKGTDGNLASHCQNCKCSPLFNERTIVFRNSD